jgi:choline dehydrogenase
VRGIEGLRIGDVSIAPDIISGGTNALAMMIGERVAAFLKN